MTFPSHAQTKRLRDYGIRIGILPTGALNAVTDVPGVRVGQVTLMEGDSIRTGVTAILPHGGNIFQQKVPGAVFVANGFGKLAGSTQVQELGAIESPIILTNTLSVAAGIEGVVQYTLLQSGNENVRSVNALVGETNDGGLNDIRGRHVQPGHVIQAILQAQEGPVKEGVVGAGTGTRCFGFKGGIGTASRKLPASMGGFTVGVLVQTNFGGVLQIDGVQVGQALGQYPYREQLDTASDGSCMIVVATDAPIDARNLERLAKRAFLGLGKTGGYASNGSGDYVIAFSTAEGLRIPHDPENRLLSQQVLHNDAVSPLFLAAVEATEEAILNSLAAAHEVRATINGKSITIPALPMDQVLPLMFKFGRLRE